MTDGSAPNTGHDGLAADVTAERDAALHALHVLEYALAAPAPRRQRTWVHRVTIAVDALQAALQTRLPGVEEPLRLLDEIALAHPAYLPRIELLREQLLDLTIAVASLREHLEPDPVLELDPEVIRNRLSEITRRFRDHQAREADLVYEAIGVHLDES